MPSVSDLKPTKFIEELIDLFSSKGDWILDGIGGLGIAAGCALLEKLQQTILKFQNPKNLLFLTFQKFRIVMEFLNGCLSSHHFRSF